MILAFVLVVSGLLEIPDAVVTTGRFGTNLKARHLPAIEVLKNCGQRVGSFGAGQVLNYDPVFSRRQAGYIEFRAAGVHSGGPKNATIEVTIGAGCGACIEQKRGANLVTGALKRRLIVIHRPG